ncbi:TetR/AcrR family transcriptional regulator [Bacillus sp. FJAT-28004]|uniref:TetR/AcrR family transcriptional regulator n=1 Tax=Bacillus sp. FJAT-28004 TaxID=1679165 RepID=UPI0007C7E356|nr:TetR/AcrR family transcriptional regulator [Bacillus sp. FJAT-28004]
MPKIVATELDWIKLGMQKFAEGGVEALVVEQLAKQLSSSKTSFYWYFKNRVLYVERIVNYWHEQTTTSIIAHIQQHDNLEPMQKVRRLLSVMFSTVEGKDFVYHFRKLGTTSSAYAELLHQIEQQRLDYMRNLLVASGLLEDEARNTAELLYSYYLGWYERNKHRTLNPEKARQQIDLLMPFIEKTHS